MKAEEKNSVRVPFSGFFMSLFSGFLFHWEYEKLAILLFNEDLEVFGILFFSKGVKIGKMSKYVINNNICKFIHFTQLLHKLNISFRDSIGVEYDKVLEKRSI